MTTDFVSLEELERQKSPWGTVTLVGLGRLGIRTALILMQAHRGGPEDIVAIDKQAVSPDDLIFTLGGAEVGEPKVAYLARLASEGFSKKVTGIAENVSLDNLEELITGDVVCIEIAGGDTLPLTAAIIHQAHAVGAATISTLGVFGVGDIGVSTVPIEQADPHNPIVRYLLDSGVQNHTLIGTGKLIRDWEPVIPPVLDKVSLAISSEILRLLHERKIRENAAGMPMP